MYSIKLSNGKEFIGDNESTIFQSAQNSGILLEHSCLVARCKSCKVRILSGQTLNITDELVLSSEEKEEGNVLSCNSIPSSDLIIEAEDLSDWNLAKSRTLPSKIDGIEYLNDDVVKIALRFPPNSLFRFLSGQYVNLIKGNVKRSYSIANSDQEEGKLEFLIKNYPNGVFSKYWFDEAKKNDLLRLEGPLGTFFLRNLSSVTDVIFLATGTGIAPVRAILDQANEQEKIYSNKRFWLVWGGRYRDDLFLEPIYSKINLTYIPVLSRKNDGWTGERGYVQEVIIKQNIDFKNAQVYACGSNLMITSAKKVLMKNELHENNFYSDAFVSSN